MNTTQDDGGPAFPLAGSSEYSYEPQDGMSLRDWLAGMAVTCVEGRLGTFDANEISARCYQLADAMLAARKEAR